MVAGNPCKKVTIPKGEVKEKPIYSQEEMAQLLTAVNGEPTKYRAFFFLIAYSGFRRSEMPGLEWKDIDFENDIISVKRTSNYTSERGIYTDTTKTKRSKRVLKISPYIMNILRELKDEQDEEAFRLGDKWVESDRLFVKWDRSPMKDSCPAASTMILSDLFPKSLSCAGLKSPPSLSLSALYSLTSSLSFLFFRSAFLFFR